MKNTIKTLALITATIGVAAVVKRVKKQGYSAVDENGITTILADGSVATLMHQTADVITTQRLLKN
ncbi:hypothetical protein ACRCJU_01750 [Aerococcus urinaeequi]|uniref:hypothetical protein n=1 Tax=Aerococcus urinaeequi TaxID=51665 RepID=UPI003D6A2B4C